MARISGIDLARAMALLGMLLVNYTVSMNAAENGPAWLVHTVGFFSGKAAALFVTLTGLGMGLASRRRSADTAPGGQRALQQVLLKRAAFLFILGLSYIALWPADILHYYAVYIAMAFACCLYIPNISGLR